MPEQIDSSVKTLSESKIILSKLNHAFTPPDLAELNRQLAVLLTSDNFLLTHADKVNSFSAVNSSDSVPSNLEIEKIIDQRANLVESLLNNLDEQQKRCFAAYEVKSNDFILQEMSSQRARAKDGLAKISKASKGIKKYQQV